MLTVARYRLSYTPITVGGIWRRISTSSLRTKRPPLMSYTKPRGVGCWNVILWMCCSISPFPCSIVGTRYSRREASSLTHVAKEGFQELNERLGMLYTCLIRKDVTLHALLASSFPYLIPRSSLCKPPSPTNPVSSPTSLPPRMRHPPNSSSPSFPPLAQ